MKTPKEYCNEIYGLVRKKVPLGVCIKIMRTLELKGGGSIDQEVNDAGDWKKGNLIDWAVGKYKVVIFNNDKYYGWISFFELYQMPHCCGICVSTASNVSPKFQKLGVATLLNQFRQDLALNLGYSIILCTDCDKNLAQKKVLQKNGWQDIFKFTNKRTRNVLNISVKQLIPEPKK